MADRKNIVTLGIGASPGGLLWFMTSGLESAAAAVSQLIDAAISDSRVNTAAAANSRAVTATITDHTRG